MAGKCWLATCCCQVLSLGGYPMRTTLYFLCVVNLALACAAAEPELQPAKSLTPEDLGIFKYVFSARPGPDEVLVFRAEEPVYLVDRETGAVESKTIVTESVSNNRDNTEIPVLIIDRFVLFPEKMTFDVNREYLLRVDNGTSRVIKEFSGMSYIYNRRPPNLEIEFRNSKGGKITFRYTVAVEKYAEVKKRYPDLPADDDTKWKHGSTFDKKD